MYEESPRFKCNQLTVRLEESIRCYAQSRRCPVFPSVLHLVIPDAGWYLLRRGCAMKSRDTASTCSLFAWWLLMVLEYISRGCVLRDTSYVRALSVTAHSDEQQKILLCRCVEKEREREMDATTEGEGEKDEEYGNCGRRARERPLRVSCLKMNLVPWNKQRKTTRIRVSGERKNSSGRREGMREGWEMRHVQSRGSD